MTELRAADLRFTPAEAAEFLNQVMGLNLSAEDIAALEARTEGWIAGLQLAALALQGLSLPGTVSLPGRSDASGFIKSFTGSHHFVLDYLIEEVLGQQPASLQTFLLRTSILERMCGPLCEAVCSAGAAIPLDPSASGQATLEYLERANLFVVPLDNERRWYRYHHLFADLLRQRLRQSAASSAPAEGQAVSQLHIRASQWYEDNGLELEAFQHAVAGNDVGRAALLVEGGKLPLYQRSAIAPVLRWLASLPTAVLDSRPALWAKFAALSLMDGQTTGVEEKLQAAEAAIAATAGPEPELDGRTRDLIGIIAAARATLAVTRYQPETIIVQSRRALEYLNPANLNFRFTAVWTLAFAYLLQGDRAASAAANVEALAISQASGEIFSILLATANLAEMQELENQLYLANETYRRFLQLSGEPPLPHACEVHLGLARIYYQWNDLAAAERHGQQSLRLARQYDSVIDRFIVCELFLVRLKLAQGDVSGAAALLAQTERATRQQNFVQRMPELASTQALVLLEQGDLAAAAQLAQAYDLPLCQARVRLAQGEPSAALALLEPLRRQMEARGWADERLKVMVLQALALRAHGEKERAAGLLGEALALAEPGSFIRLFIDEGPPMQAALCEFRWWVEKQPPGQEHELLGYVDKLLAAFAPPAVSPPSKIENLPSSLLEPLSQRELKVLQLVAQGLSNREISERLFLALSTVKGHNQKIFDKLQVQSRTEAIARARQLGLL